MDSLEEMLALEGADEVEALFRKAYAVKLEHIGPRVSVRGLIEAGNACAKDCFYCGIRKSNLKVQRYELKEDEMVELARKAKDFGYASVVIQSGEIESEEHTRKIERTVQRIAELNMGITLSLGEQDADVYKRWREAGATRYLLRIETANRQMYARLHPESHSYDRRLKCLKELRKCDYQVGTGVMCALPGESVQNLADAIRFFRDEDVDMIGMGPYIPHPDTPLGVGVELDKERRLITGLKMIAAARITLPKVNIAAATALQALAEDGRERGIKAGANVLMPNVTDVEYRANYQLYAGKPCLNENAGLCRACLDRRLEAIGEKILYGERGDSLRYFERCRNEQR